MLNKVVCLYHKMLLGTLNLEQKVLPGKQITYELGKNEKTAIWPDVSHRHSCPENMQLSQSASCPPNETSYA
jgi:hypothetical protein